MFKYRKDNLIYFVNENGYLYDEGFQKSEKINKLPPIKPVDSGLVL